MFKTVLLQRYTIMTCFFYKETWPDARTKPNTFRKQTSFVIIIYLGDITDERINNGQAHSTGKRFLSSRRGLSLQPPDDEWEAQTIDLRRLRWRAGMQVQHTPCQYGSCDLLIMIFNEIYVTYVGAWRKTDDRWTVVQHIPQKNKHMSKLYLGSPSESKG